MENDLDFETIKDTRDQETLMNIANPIIKKMAGYLVFNGSIDPEFKDDLVQDAIYKLLVQKDEILKNFKGISSFKTYLTSVIYRQCYRILQSNVYRKRTSHTPVELILAHPQEISKQDFLYLYKQLDNVFEMYHKKKFRIVFCLKLIYSIPVESIDEVKLCFPLLPSSEHEIVFRRIKELPVDISNKDVFRTITPFINLNDQKENTPDAIRKWVYLKIEEMIDILNHSNSEASFTKETFQILVEKYFMEK